LKQKQDELASLKFTPTKNDAVELAKSKAQAATTAKNEACNKPLSQRCRDRQKDEIAALGDAAKATQEMNATDHAQKLDQDITKLNEKIEKAGPVLEANSQGGALARLFNLPDDDKDAAKKLSTYQNLAMGFGIELLIALALILYEVMTEHERERMPKTAPASPAARPIELELEPEAVAIAAPVIEAEKPVEPAPVLKEIIMEEEPKAFPVRSRPRLIASQPDPVGSVPEILAEVMEKGGRGKLEIREIFKACSEACRAHGKRFVSEAEFPALLVACCKAADIEVEISDGRAYLLNVRLKPPKKHSNSIS
jgi:hypothetical protein